MGSVTDASQKATQGRGTCQRCILVDKKRSLTPWKYAECSGGLDREGELRDLKGLEREGGERREVGEYWRVVAGEVFQPPSSLACTPPPRNHHPPPLPSTSSSV
ncbi:hypothetical protein PAMP_023276 [Pampus punctatissimus]